MELESQDKIEVDGRNLDVRRGGSDMQVDPQSVVELADYYIRAVSDTDEEFERYRDEGREDFADAVKDSKTVLICDGQRLIGFGMWQVDGSTPDGNPVCEWRRIVVLPEFQGKKISGQIISNLEDDIRAFNPRAVMTTITRRKSLINPALGRGYCQVSYLEFETLAGANGRMSSLAEKGYSILVLDPNEVIDKREGFGDRMSVVSSLKNNMTLVDFTDADMDYFHQLEGEDGWIALGMENCKNQRYYVVTGDSGERLGIVGVYDTDNEENITHIVVDPEYRGRGLAGKFYEALLEKTGLDFLIATISRSNVASVRAHEKAGFRKVSDSVYEEQFDKFKYRLGD